MTDPGSTSRDLRTVEELFAYLSATRASVDDRRVRQALGWRLVDHVGVLIAGWGSPLIETLGKLATRTAQGPVATPLEDPGSIQLLGAASHALDYDDTHNAVPGHPTGPVASAVVPHAFQQDASLGELLTAVAVGVETACILGQWLGADHYDGGWHATASVGSVAAASGVATLLDLSADQWAVALGLAATNAAGWQRSFGTDAKPIQVGLASQQGAWSAVAVKAGITAPPWTDDLVAQMARMYSAGQVQPAQIDTDHLHVERTLIKLHACCHVIHPVLEAIASINAHDSMDAEQVERIHVEVPQRAADRCAHHEAQTGREAQFSIPRCVGFLLTGLDTTDPDTFVDDNVTRPEVTEIALRTQVRGNSAMDFGTANVAVHLRDGTVRSAHGDVNRTWDATRYEDQYRAKFAALTRGVLTQDQAEQLIHALVTGDTDRPARSVLQPVDAVIRPA